VDPQQLGLVSSNDSNSLLLLDDGETERYVESSALRTRLRHWRQVWSGEHELDWASLPPRAPAKRWLWTRVQP
jgi:hypothetical protein